MNIVKFKDIILTEENAAQLTPEQIELFNTKFRGKFVYAVDWLLCTPIESMSEEQYIKASQDLANEDFGIIYTRVKSFQDLCKDGVIDLDREYILGWSNDTDTHIPGLHEKDETNWKSGYYPDVEINNFVLSDKFKIGDSSIDQRLRSGTRLRAVPLVEQNDPERIIDLDGYAELKTTTYFKQDTSLTIRCYYGENVDISGFNDDYEYKQYYSSWVDEDQEVTINIVYPSYRGVIIIIRNEDNEEVVRYEFTYRDAPEIPSEGFFLQDLNYPFDKDSSSDDTKSSEEDTDSEQEVSNYECLVNDEFFYATQSGNNVSYGNPELLDRTYRSGSIQGIWILGEDEQGIGIQSWNNHRYICYNMQSPRFNLYNPSLTTNSPKLAGLYRREVIEPQSLKDFDYISYSLLTEYVDIEETSNANSVVLFLAANKYSSDEDITVEELKKFRTWLATYLLYFDQDDEGKQQYKIFDEETTHMLLYYKKEMYDDVIKYLSKFSDQTFTLVSTVSSCGCNSLGTVGGTVVNTLPYTNLKMTSCGCNTNALSGNKAIDRCDPIMIYRKNIYLKMVKTFSVIDFWKTFGKNFLTDFKKYIDGIIKLNLPLTTSTFISTFADCGCLNQADAEQLKNISILKDLSRSIQYLIDDQESGNKNFIQNTLQSWSSLLYESMRW